MTTSTTSPSYKGISGSTLKIIAIITMLIDHIGAVLISDQSSPVYLSFRLVGRIAFPIFCFLLVEGFLHTRNVTRYGLRLFIFALISEIPFDLALYGSLFYFDSQNVFFTLFIGLITITVFSKLEKNFYFTPWLATLGKLLALLTGMAIAHFAGTDYGYTGVLTIAILYSLHKSPVLAMTCACFILTLMNILEVSVFWSLLLVQLYNGKRGLQLKYVFYIFYPAHLLLLYFLGRLL